jgi:hypothetical protein
MSNDDQRNVPPGTISIVQAVTQAAAKGQPPVHLWNPPLSGTLDMRIARDGTWFYNGTPIKRPGLVRLFASVLKREGDDYFLVTPVEKFGIEVDDAPFVAVDFEIEGEADAPILVFETNTGDFVRAGAENAVTVSVNPETGEPSPYIHVRNDLHALIDRKSFYRLADRAEAGETDEGPCMVVRSGDETFMIGPMT